MSTPQNFVVIPGTELAPRPGTRVVGLVNPDERAELTIRLRPKAGQAGAKSLEETAMEMGAQKPGERTYLTQNEYDNHFGADPGDVAKVEAFAKAHGFDVLKTSTCRRTVELAGPLGKLAAAFDVSLSLSSHENHTFRERTGPVSVPEDLDGVVVGVFGFDTRRMAEPQRRVFLATSKKHKPKPTPAPKPTPTPPPAPTPPPHRPAGGPFTALDVAALYNFPTGLDGTGQCIGILEFGGGFGSSDLNSYFNNLGIRPPQVVAVAVDSGSNRPGSDPNADGEVLLDIEIAGAVAPGAKIAVYFSTFTVKGWVDALTQAIHDTTNNPSVISISWGFAEQEPIGSGRQSTTIWTQAAVDAVNQALAAAATLGVTVICAAGDDGSADQFNDGLDHVDFPASSPYLLACGGTKLVGSGGTITSEVVWNEKANNEGATGGGISQLNPLPAYQTNLPLPSSNNPGNFAGRGLPDIAGNADPVTGFATISDGQAQVVGGTSAVAPLWAGLIALINEGLKTRVGFINPLLYQTIGPAGVLNDITQGNNGDFTAGPGWDACTGWGTPNGVKLMAALKG